jgi:PGF-pre-PGF domain-containing protein
VPLLAFASTPARAQTSGLNLSYTVTIQKGQPYAHVKLEISGITSSSLTLRFREEAWYAENYVHNLSASSGGSFLTITDQGQGIWRVDSVGSSLTLEYDIEKMVPFGYYTPNQNEISVYLVDDGGVIMPPYFFIYPDVDDANSIQIKFNVPADWKVVTPYVPEGDHFEVQRITQSLLVDFINRQVIYMGKMKFYAEQENYNCTFKFGVLEIDKSYETVEHLKTQADVENVLNISVNCFKTLMDLFGEKQNPYKVFVLYTNYFAPSPNGPGFPPHRYNGNCYAIFKEHQWDIQVGHMIYAFEIAKSGIWSTAPLFMNWIIMKGFGEMYYGPVLAWRMFKDPIYPGRLYYWYLVYERFSQSNKTTWWEFPQYIKGPFVALMLDSEIKNATNGTKSLDDVMKYLYSTYKNTGYEVDYPDIEAAAKTIIGKDFSELFSRYVYGNEKIPYRYIQDYKPYFLDFPHRFPEVYGYSTNPPLYSLYSNTIPFFINTEILVRQVEQNEEKYHAPQNAFFDIEFNLKNFADYMLSHYTVDNLTEKDVEDALSAVTGADCSGFFTRWENSYGRLSVEEVKDWLHDYSKGQEGGGETPGGGGGTPPTMITYYLPPLKKGENFSIRVENTAISEIALEAENDISGASFAVWELTGKPAGIAVEPSGATYKYLNVETENLTDAQIGSVTIRFSVEKSWINANGIGISTVTLNRYNPAASAWTALPTTLVGEDGGHAYFSAVSPGLSVFAISGQPAEGPSPWNLVIVVIGIIIVAVVVILGMLKGPFRKRRG